MPHEKPHDLIESIKKVRFFVQLIKVYDLPIRIFHWLFAGLFILSFSIGKFIDDESVLYAYHMLSGLLMSFIVLLRLVWGYYGSRYAKFKSFPLKLEQLKSYFNSLFDDQSMRYTGHNPASSYASLSMYLMSICLATTGLLMSFRVNKHFFEEIHELTANAFVLVVIAHIVGVVLHRIRHKDQIMSSMFNGKKDMFDEKKEIESNHPLIAILFVILVGLGSLSLLSSYNVSSGKLNLWGLSLQLGEMEDNSDFLPFGYIKAQEEDDDDERD